MSEKFSDLLFELSHEDRLRIIYQIQTSPEKLTHLSEKLRLQVQETSRHLSRLSEAKLILKDVEGFYHLTPYGDHVIKLLTGYEFLSKHRNYFLTHKSTHLPEQFVNRIGELNRCTFTDNFMVSFQEAKTLFEEAREHIWAFSDHISPSTPPLIEDAMKRGVKVRWIFLKDIDPPVGYEPMPFIPNRIEMKISEQIEVSLCMSEKKGLIDFPTLEGKIDHRGWFISTDEISNRWGGDLFEYYWERAKIGKPENLSLNRNDCARA